MDTFKTINENMTLKKEHEALSINTEAFKDDSQYIYVLDTNCLLMLFWFGRNQLSSFVESLKTGIYYGTRQIEREFLRNKDYTERNALTDIVNNFPNDYEKQVKDSYEKLLVRYKHLISTKATFENALKKLSANINTVFGKILEFKKYYLLTNTIDIKDIIENAIINNVDMSVGLDATECSQLKDEYDSLVQNYHNLLNKKTEHEHQYREYVFPGMGETKKINPEGDYIIFHEMVLLAKKMNKNIVFLTNDIEKNDWLMKDTYYNYNHYLSIFYSLSGYSLTFQRFANYLKDKCKIDIDYILNTDYYRYDSEFVENYLLLWQELDLAIHNWGVKNGYDKDLITTRIINKANADGKISNGFRNAYKNFYKIHKVILLCLANNKGTPTAHNQTGL
jgi:hypothetical protein